MTKDEPLPFNFWTSTPEPDYAEFPWWDSKDPDENLQYTNSILAH